MMSRRARQLNSRELSFSLSAADPSSPWYPLNMNRMRIDELDGTMTLSPSGGLTATVTGAGNMAIGSMSLNWQATARVTGTGSSVSDLQVSATGQATFGGNDGFQVGVTGTFDQVAGTTVMEVSHAGGWSPLKGSFDSFFKTPAFNGQLSIGMANKPIKLDARITFGSDIRLIEDVLVLRAHPAETAGPKLRVHGSGDLTDFTYTVGLSAGLRLGSASSAIPLLAVTGSLVSSGTSTYALSPPCPMPRSHPFKEAQSDHFSDRYAAPLSVVAPRTAA